jgi:ribosomal silencing factor RsfS
MAMAVDIQRLELGDVVVIDHGAEGKQVEAKVMQPIERTETSVRVTLRVEGQEDLVREFRLGEQITVVRGP